MKWKYLAVLCAIQCLPLVAGTKKPKTSFEEKLKRLEEDTGIDTVPEKMTGIVSAEFLYWMTSLDGVAYATTAVGKTSSSGALVNDNYKSRTAHFDYSPGFRIGVGMGLPHDHWDLGAYWLRFYPEGKDHAHGATVAAPGNKVIFDTIGALELLDSPPSQAKARCNVHLNILDAVLGRTFLWSRFFTFRPFAGIRAVWLTMDWDIAYQTPVRIPSAAPQTNSKMDVDNHYNAAGFVGGVETKWNIYKGFGLFSEAAITLVYGKSSEKTVQKFSLVPAMGSHTFTQTLTATNATHTVKGAFDISLGVKWERDFSNRLHFLTWVGYEFFYWPNIAQKTIVQTLRSRDRPDLGFEGLIVGARVSY